MNKTSREERNEQSKTSKQKQIGRRKIAEKPATKTDQKIADSGEASNKNTKNSRETSNKNEQIKD